MSPRRTDTRERAVKVAIELFTSRGYEQTSLRDIAERLEITKAALYFHFHSKEELLQAVLDSAMEPVDELAAWIKAQEPSPEMRRELLRKLRALVQGPWGDWMRFVQENQPALRNHPEVGEQLGQRMFTLLAGVLDPEAEPRTQVRTLLAFLAVYFGSLSNILPDAMRRQLGITASSEELADAAMDIAYELISDDEGSRPLGR